VLTPVKEVVLMIFLHITIAAKNRVTIVMALSIPSPPSSPPPRAFGGHYLQLHHWI